MIRASDGSTERHSFVAGMATEPGDVIRIVTGIGGGYGDPRDRDPDQVRDDVRDGFISAERAAEVYGVDVQGTTAE